MLLSVCLMIVRNEADLPIEVYRDSFHSCVILSRYLWATRIFTLAEAMVS
jgi:hypothetical protein